MDKKLFYWVAEAQKRFVYPPEQELYDFAMKLATTHNQDKRKEIIRNYLKEKAFGHPELKALLKGRAVAYINDTFKKTLRAPIKHAQTKLQHNPSNISADNPHVNSGK